MKISTQSKISLFSTSLWFFLFYTLNVTGCSQDVQHDDNKDTADIPVIEDTNSNPEVIDTESDPIEFISCEGISCYTPPKQTCSDNTTLETFNYVGWCESGSCQYASYTESCDVGTCENGVCISSPCQGVSCTEPPKSMCVDDYTLVHHNPFGYCSSYNTVAECRYAPTLTECEDGCQDGHCVGAVCIGAVCNKPPARYCEVDELVIFTPSGQCGGGECLYAKQNISCGPSGCSKGHCVDDDVCAYVTCNMPPANFCVDDLYLRVFDHEGYCKEGSCEHPYEDVECDNGCSRGQCTGDPCLGVTCTTPPAPYCKNDTTVASWDGSAANCVNGKCVYNIVSTECSSDCEEGACENDPCIGVACLFPPAPHCEDNTLVTYESEGTCSGDGWCDYTESRYDCLVACEDASCVDEVDTENPQDTDTSTDTIPIIDTDSCPLDDPDDLDSDGICESDDTCFGNNYTGDYDGDGVCNDQDPCPSDNPDDPDGDSICQTDDACPDDNPNDADSDGVCASVDQCIGDDATGDWDNNGTCNDLDPPKPCDPATGWFDVTTGLCWLKQGASSRTYGEAESYCAGLTHDDATWRLPTISEERSIVRECAHNETGGICQLTDSCKNWEACASGCNQSCGGAGGCNYYPTEANFVDAAGCITPHWTSTEDEPGEHYTLQHNIFGNISKVETTAQFRCVHESNGSNLLAIQPTVAVGEGNACVLTSAGKVKCWGGGGLGINGQGDTVSIGDDEYPNTIDFIDMPGTIAQLGANGYSFCALTHDRKVVCWGTSSTGQLGYGNTDRIGDDETPADAGFVDIGGDVEQISVGYDHTCALLSTGKVRCWGSGSYGKLGYANTNHIGDDETPASAGDVDVGPGTVVQVAAGRYQSCVLFDDGKVKCWGYGLYGTLGYANTTSIGDDEPPSAVGYVDVGADVAYIAAGDYHTCTVTTAGNARCWGDGGNGRLGNGQETDIGDNEHPSGEGDINMGKYVSRITAGGSQTCALTTNGNLRCFGWGQAGRLAYGNTTSYGSTLSTLPTHAGDVPIGKTVVAVDSGSWTSCALTNTNSVRCWGPGGAQNGYGHTSNIGDQSWNRPSDVGDIPLY